MPPKGKGKAKRGGSSAKQKQDNAEPALKKAAIKVKPERVGVALCIGMNMAGQLGVGEHLAERKKPALLKKGTLAGHKAIAVAAGGMHTAIVDDKFQLHTFGCSDDGALGRATSSDEEGVPALGDGLQGVSVIEVTGGDSHLAVRDVNGDVYACGCFRDDDGALAFSPTALVQNSFVRVFPTEDMLARANKASARGKPIPSAASISSGADHLVILTTDGKVYTMGTGKQGQLGRVAERFSLRDSARDPRNESSAEIRSKRTTVQFLKRVLIPQEVTNHSKKKFKRISTGSWATFAVDEDNQLWAWGLNNYHQLGVPRDDEEAVGAEGNCSFKPELASVWDGLDISEIQGAQHHTIAFSASTGKVYALGRGDCGRLGNGKTESSTEPVHIADLDDKKIASIVTGTTTSYALSEDGSAYAWGFGENLQLTNDDESDALSPLLMSGKQLEKRSVVQISAGGQHAVLLATPPEVEDDKDKHK